jgi:hypothetical protein
MSKNLNFFAKHKLDQFCQRRSKLSNNVDHVAGVLGIVVLKKRKYICVIVVTGFTIGTAVIVVKVVIVVTVVTDVIGSSDCPHSSASSLTVVIVIVLKIYKTLLI